MSESSYLLLLQGYIKMMPKWSRPKWAVLSRL
nr:MAG TPA: hypothetical protein [Caudoviricetes sp.]